MEKMKMESANITDMNIEKIAALFPNCITETADENGKLKKAVNFEMLRAMLSEDIAEGDEAYEFTWVGKKAAIAEANRPIRKTLRPCVEESVNWDTTENLYIEGDNLEVLKLLQESYLKKVDMIFIDPPYNTGSDFIYRDDFYYNEEEYSLLNGEINDDGERLFKNTDANGRFHSDWCSMIYSRLLLARNLLSPTGSIFITIDDNEYANLKEICDEVFGGKNYISTVIWENFYGRSNAAAISPAHNYVLIYSLAGDAWKYVRNLLPRTEESSDKYKNPDNDPRGPWRLGPIFASGERHEGLMYTITTPAGKKISPPKGSHWRMLEEDFWNMVKDGRIMFGMNGDGAPATKLFLSDVQSGMVPRSIWLHGEVGHSQEAKREIQALFPDNIPFDTPKPTRLLKQIITIGANSNALIMDFFSGSASTADAVMQLNKSDNGNRKYIMVQLDEPITEEGYIGKNKTIADIGKERIRRAGVKIKEDSPLTTSDLDIGFRVLKLDDTNMQDVYYTPAATTQQMIAGFESNIKEDRTDLDLLFGCLLDWGLPLSMPYSSEQIEGVTVHTYNEGDLIACFDKAIPESVIKTIAKRQPLRVVFRDDSFADSPSKINVSEIFKMLSPDTRVKVI
ncbi:site-specific DNA-methyltransferase [Ruminococcus flavefaciens]|uniref:Adenine-specific DNA-methyltransferase n=1 Tax=Ruminococcus flavefaciens TaxID=1265 RepID=A0A315Y0W0_RUMFL|nr:site-specific DNA-methyltransferase [Ruminococcus flavefaciens]PWJ11969.1 adenine-specific DNA-methyltransferase [Ruminococcus flavefaciens]SSA50279.1 adenine-specific DNA-methyltransferase [Ruminococcus flavefaciens]